jgi:hypothetical protein
MLRDTCRRGAAARFSRRLHPSGVKLDRLDGHPKFFYKWDIVGPNFSSKGPKIACRGIRTASNDPSLQTQGDICTVPDNTAGSVRVGSICLSHALGTHKKVGPRKAPNS